MTSRAGRGPRYHLAAEAHHPAGSDDLTALCHTAWWHIRGPSDARVSRLAVENIAVVVRDLADAAGDSFGHRSRSFTRDEGIAGDARLRDERSLDNARERALPLDAREVGSRRFDFLVVHHGREADHRWRVLLAPVRASPEPKPEVLKLTHDVGVRQTGR